MEHIISTKYANGMGMVTLWQTIYYYEGWGQHTKLAAKIEIINTKIILSSN